MGARLGPYEILAPLGAGGMGEVYRARDSRLGREVAVKILPPHLSADPQALARFEREAGIVAALSHPNIVVLFDIGSDHGVSYAVTELLEGETLRSRLRRGALPHQEAAEIGAAIAEGLAAVHSRGIVHRDLKPENIFLTSAGRIKILDFGLAQPPPVDPAGAPDVTRTDPGVLMGTIGYMSPEQVQGRPLDSASDMFSLGCVLYEMLSGRRAFACPSPAETLAAILKEEPPRLAQISAGFDNLIARCLAKRPHERLRAAGDLALALRDIASPRSSPVSAKIRLIRRAAVFLIVLLALAAYLFFFRSRPIDSIAVLPFDNATTNPDTEYLSEGITESIIRNLSTVPRLRVVPRSTVFRYKGRNPDPQKAGQELNARAVLTGRVLERGGNLIVTAELVDVSASSQIWGEQYNRKLSDVLSLEEEISKEIAGKLRLRLSGNEQKHLTRRYTENTEAYQLYLKGRYHWNKRTPQGYSRATDYFQQAIDKDPAYALAYAGLADSYSLVAWYGLATPKESYGKARASAARALALDESLPEAHVAFATPKQFLEWDWAGAEKHFRRALDLNPGYAVGHQRYGNYLRIQRKLDQAVAEVRRSLELDPLNIAANVQLGLDLYLSRQYDQAIEQYHKTLELDANFAVGHLLLGMAYDQKAMYAPAIASLQKAVSLFEGEPIATAMLTRAYAASGAMASTRELLSELNRIRNHRYVSAYLFALIHVGLGEKEQAWQWLERAFEERSAWLADRVTVDPMLDPLRADPRFAALLRRMNLAP